MKVIVTDDYEVYAIKGNEYKHVTCATESIIDTINDEMDSITNSIKNSIIDDENSDTLPDEDMVIVDAAKKEISKFEDLSSFEPEKWYAPFDKFFGLDSGDVNIIYETHLDDSIW
jgi:hypothetical protein